MIASTRRSFVAALLGLGMLGAGALPRPLRAATPDRPLRLPDRPLRLLRVLAHGPRAAGGGPAAITVTRAWQVAFERQARGIVATGQQTAVRVEAPPHLAELARIEEGRDASAMFPLMLSDEGAIINPPVAPECADHVAAALRAAEGVIARRKLPADEEAQARHYLAEVHRAGMGLLDVLPADLLFPSGVPIERRETVALPEGMTGQFELTYAAVPQPDAPWLARAERRVVTRLAGHVREASEVWTMGPAEP